MILKRLLFCLSGQYGEASGTYKENGTEENGAEEATNQEESTTTESQQTTFQTERTDQVFWDVNSVPAA